LSQDVFFASFAYVLLYITVLTPGILITVYLKTKGFQDIVIGVFRGLGAVSGVSVTFITPYLFHWIGPEKGGLVAIWFQFSTLTVGMVFVFVFDQMWAMYVLLAAIILSRVSMCVYTNSRWDCGPSISLKSS
jgi:hypothetical protein